MLLIMGSWSMYVYLKPLKYSMTTPFTFRQKGILPANYGNGINYKLKKVVPICFYAMDQRISLTSM